MRNTTTSLRNRFTSAPSLYSTVVEVRAASNGRTKNALLHYRFTATHVRSSPSAQSGLDGCLSTHQRACHHRSAPEVGHVASAWFFFGRHVASPPVANQPAGVQCASRSFTKVFVGRRLAPLPAPGKYRCPSSARLARSSATLAVMASLNHLYCSQACGAKYGAHGRLAALPNPSLKLSANGVPHWPPSAVPSAHFALAVQRATPSTPAYLER